MEQNAQHVALAKEAAKSLQHSVYVDPNLPTKPIEDVGEWMNWFQQQPFFDTIKRDFASGMSADMLMIRCFTIGFKAANGDYKKDKE
jgi:hypothetical protein